MTALMTGYVAPGVIIWPSNTNVVPKTELDPSLRRMLTNALANLREWGWTSGTMLERSTGRVCAVGALLGAIDGVERVLVPNPGCYRFVIPGSLPYRNVMMIDYPQLFQAAAFVMAKLGRTYHPSEDPAVALTRWNDTNHADTVLATFEGILES